MSRLCRLKTKTHGEDGQWAYDEIVKLSQRVAELEKELSKCQESEFHPDWSLLQASQEALREHMELCKQLTAERDELKGELLSAAMESTPTAQIERQRKTILELQSVLHDARSVLIAWAANHESQVTQETINKINEVLNDTDR